MAGPAAGGDRQYKRSWKNLLINKRYQLQFTLFMVGLSGLLMIGLGVWVMKEANEATAVGMASVRGTSCGPQDYTPLTVGSGAGSAVGSAATEDEDAPTPMKLDEDGSAADGSAAAAGTASGGSAAASGGSAAANGGSASGGSAAASGGSAAASGGSAAASGGSAAGSDAPAPKRRRAVVQLDESSMTMVAAPTPPPPTEDEIKAHRADIFGNRVCASFQQIQFGHLEFGRLRILLVMIFTGLALVVGLAVYGIKMTHKVAGPLFKVSLYLNKMREGRFDKVWNLRKGDQLVDFYEHFKSAHAGMVNLEKSDIERIKGVIAAAEASGLGDHEAVGQLRTVLARKEKALE